MGLLPKPILHCLFKLCSKIPKYCRNCVKKGKSATRIPALTSQKSALFPGKLVNTWHAPLTKHTTGAQRSRSCRKTREESPAGENVSLSLPIGGFHSWSKLIQIATEKRSSGENNSVIKYENSGLPKYQDWKEKADLSKTQNLSSALTHAASPELMKAQAIKEHKCFSSPHLPQAFQLCSHLSTQKCSCS